MRKWGILACLEKPHWGKLTAVLWIEEKAGRMKQGATMVSVSIFCEPFASCLAFFLGHCASQQSRQENVLFMISGVPRCSRREAVPFLHRLHGVCSISSLTVGHGCRRCRSQSGKSWGLSCSVTFCVVTGVNLVLEVKWWVPVEEVLGSWLLWVF